MSSMIRRELKMLLPRMLLLDALAYGISIFFLGFRLPMALGLLIGTIGEVISLILLGNAVEASLRKKPKQAKISMAVSYVGRTILTAGVIAYAYVSRDIINPVGTALPFIFPKLIYFIQSISPKERRDRNG